MKQRIILVFYWAYYALVFTLVVAAISMCLPALILMMIYGIIELAIWLIFGHTFIDKVMQEIEK